jgi:hypothetical protein|tara:strand:- start:6002 stop:6181 length:180 start_codon:yes stop_codon:yes gene_type:complete
MRFFVKCDICNKEFVCEQMRIPKGISLIDGNDMCKSCQMEYAKRRREMLNKLQKERYNG